MALSRRGALFAGALFSGLLFGPQPVEAAQPIHQGGPDKQLVERITRPANWAPKHELDLDVPESPYAKPAPVITTVPGEVPTAPLPKAAITAKPDTVVPISAPAKVVSPDTAAPLSEQDALAMVLAALFVLDDD
jgi:hypothetical protein